MHVEHDLGLLPHLDVGELGLLEVGFQPRPAVSHKREQRRLRLDLLAELQAEIDDGAGVRRYSSLFSDSFASARISRRFAFICSTAARAESTSASALASASW